MTDTEITNLLLKLRDGFTPKPGYYFDIDDMHGKNFQLIAPTWRLMVSLEENPEQSGWHLIFVPGPPYIITGTDMTKLEEELTHAFTTHIWK